MITHSDDGPDFEPDDPLAGILRPTSDYLGPPVGRYEEIRRGASRRRLLRAAAGVGLSCVAAACIALPLLLTTPGAPVSPTVPLAPPTASSPSTGPTPPASPERVNPRPSEPSRTDSPATPSNPAVSTGSVPSAKPTPQSVEPPVRNGARASAESSTRL
ncbi:hypothetical protein [Streptomyces sp. H27-C3]|uniref:hypothetical protein n=1 Tax=Streptomyces sp. H27-C3 TaxID=3046305 RepID=UPI0024B90242|nr:hypothetical protein [Streptomyces sp. H27-C3]MDJ0466963.1 hypothetical protein [Streptomyces sp. H27-C3]